MVHRTTITGKPRKKAGITSKVDQPGAPAITSHRNDDEERPRKRAKTAQQGPRTLLTKEKESLRPSEEDEPRTLIGDPEIAKTHKLFELSIITSSEMRRKISRLLSDLATFSWTALNAKPVMVLVRADGPAVSKAISVIEITKTELNKEGYKWYQYSTVKPKIKHVPRVDVSIKAKGGRTLAEWEQERTAAAGSQIPQALPDSADEDDGEDAFERMDGNTISNLEGTTKATATSNATHKNPGDSASDDLHLEGPM